ncbi:MAG TPA: SCO family protein [Sphingomicrobium sp.]|nr:SCO family protein [Sphingomicrobium sp.]
MIRQVRLILWLLVAIALAGMAYLALRPAPSAELAGQSTPMAPLGGPFTLTGSDGKPFSSSRLNGRPYAIFFGFTHCPDVCPTTLARMVRLRKQLGPQAEDLAIVFVSVDPERDGPAEVGRYAALFGEPIIGLTGSQSQVDQVKKQFGIFSEKVPESGGNYTVDHTATVLLFDRSGKFDSTIAPEEQDEAALAKLRRIAG